MSIITESVIALSKDINVKKQLALESICKQLGECWDEPFMRRITRTTKEGEPDTDHFWLDFSTPKELHLATFVIKYPDRSLGLNNSYSVTVEIQSAFNVGKIKSN